MSSNPDKKIRILQNRLGFTQHRLRKCQEKVRAKPVINDEIFVEVAKRAVLGMYALYYGGYIDYFEAYMLMCAGQHELFRQYQIEQPLKSTRIGVNVTRGLKKMRLAGLVECDNPAARRDTRWYYLTPTGRERYEALMDVIYNQKADIKKIRKPRPGLKTDLDSSGIIKKIWKPLNKPIMWYIEKYYGDGSEPG